MDNQVSSPPVTIQQKSNSTEASTFANFNPTASEFKQNKKEKSVEEVHKPIEPFSNRLKSNKSNAQMDKILEIFNQVNINALLLDATQQVPSYEIFLKDMCTKKRKINVLIKVFLATNISELLSGPIPIKCKILVVQPSLVP